MKPINLTPKLEMIPMKDMVVIPPTPSMGEVFGGIAFGGGDSTVPNANNKSITTIANAINAEGNFVNEVINTKLDTAAKTILGDFTFGVSGAIKMITDADNGLWLSPTGILAKKLGANTFTIGIDGSATFAGMITASAGSIGGWAISATALYYDGATDALSAGMASADYPFYAGKKYADRATAPFRVTPAGALVASSATITGTLTAAAGSVIATSYLSGLVAQSNLNIANQGWTQICIFSSMDLNTVSWGAGTLTTAGGTTYNIGAGNTGNMAARTYIYLDIAVSTIAYQTTTTASIAVGTGKILIATAINGAVEATFEVFGGVGGLKVLATDALVANSITAGLISVSSLSAISANIGTITAGSITGVTITGGIIQTATVNQRVSITDNKIYFYNPDNVLSGSIIGVGTEVQDGPWIFISGAVYSDSDIRTAADIILHGAYGNRFYLSDAMANLTWLEVENPATRTYSVGCHANFSPTANNTYDLGNSTNKWKDLYLSGNITVAGTVDGVDISTHAGDASAHHSSTSNGINIAPLTVGCSYWIQLQRFLYLGNMTGTAAASETALNGAMYYRTDDHVIRVYLNGAWKTITTT